jgi:small nuclear ribonucleoprotein (snRNP)-like protein
LTKSVPNSQKTIGEIMLGKFVLVTTKYRGVFAGILKEKDGNSRCVLTDCRNAIRFGTTEGFLELASSGPTSDSKIGASALEVELWDLTSYTICTDVAEAAWRAA